MRDYFPLQCGLNFQHIHICFKLVGEKKETHTTWRVIYNHIRYGVWGNIESQDKLTLYSSDTGMKHFFLPLCVYMHMCVCVCQC